MMNKWKISILISFLAVFSVQAEVLDEWAFESDDVVGTTLNTAINIGSDGSVFTTGGEGVLETDGASVLNVTPATGSLWTNGTELDAPLGSGAVTNGIHYLRYDLEYDVSGDSVAGSALGISFTDGSAEVGMAVAYDITGDNAVDWAEAVSSILPLQGTLTAIAELDLDQSTMRIWYGTSDDDFSYNDSSFTSTVSITSISDLRVRATGDSTGATDDFINVENLRRADSWADIILAVPDYTASPSIVVTLEQDFNAIMAKGETNEVSVILTGSVNSASNVTSTLVLEDASADFDIIPPASVLWTTLEPNQVVTNVYQVVASEAGTYVLTAQAYVDDVANGTTATLSLSVGSRISTSYVVQNDSGGLYSGEVEPGETFEIVVTSINDGATDLTSVTNSVTAENAGYFSILPLQEIYSSLVSGATTSTTYQVSCSADTPDGVQAFYLVNQSGDNSWTQEIEIDVRREESFSVSSNAVSYVVLSGETGSAELTIANTGNIALDFTVTGDGIPVLYTVTTQQVDRFTFLGDQEGVLDFDSSDSTNSVTMDLTKDFSLFGSTCNQFSVGRDGTVSMMADGVEVGSVFPYQTTNTLVDASSIHAVQSGSELIVAWGTEISEAGALQEFQARIDTDGTIQYYYETGDWDEGEIGVSSADGYEETSSVDTDLLSSTGLELSPVQWVSFSPSSGTLDVSGTQSLVISADASLASGTNEFTLAIAGGDTTEEITVTVVVEALSCLLTVTPPTGWEGPAGLWSTDSSMVVSNGGNVAVGVAFVGGSYDVESVEYNWLDTQVLSPTELTQSQLGSESVEIGFAFAFYGETFTNVIVNQEGTLSIGDGFAISPFGTDLGWDASNSSVSYFRDAIHKQFAVTWENLVTGSSDYQTFQAVLYESGDISFNYKELNGAWYDASIGVTGPGTTEGTLISDTTVVDEDEVTYETTLTTNWANYVTSTQTAVSTNTVSTTNSVVTEQSIEFAPNHIISCAEITDTLEPGAVVFATLTADGRDLVSGDEVSQTFTFTAEYDSEFEQSITLGDSYTWVQSTPTDATTGSGNVRDYYIDSPNFSEPSAVYLDGVELEEVSSPTILDAETWAWGDENDLGYDTLYIRIASTVAASVPSADSNVSLQAVWLGVDAVVTFTATNSVEVTSLVSEDQASLAWGSDEAEVSSEVQSDGSTLLSWPVASDGFERTYTIYYTLSLASDWIWLAETDEAVYVDSAHLDEDSIFYKVTVE
jgi:hypothetical protein